MQQLDGETVRLLAGTQTISSVQAVVKELVENSLDAAATNIEVKLENYGLDVIEVCDNGSGISGADAINLARPHFTSKITSFRDLCDLRSYGFRGEALSSIATVSNLLVSTHCPTDEGVGRQYDFDKMGNSVWFGHVAMEQGTVVCVSGLFKNIPVRRQFLKSVRRCREDLKKLEDTLLAFGIAHPRVRLVLKHNKCLLWQKVRHTDYCSNLSQVLGLSVTQHLTAVSASSVDPCLKLSGHVPSPGVADAALVSRSVPDRLFVFVNNRPVTIKKITRIARESFVSVFPSQSGRHPVAVLHLDLPPASFDVNLDPSKTSVLLVDIDFVCSTLTSLLGQLYCSDDTTEDTVPQLPSVGQGKTLERQDRASTQPNEAQGGHNHSRTTDSAVDTRFALTLSPSTSSTSSSSSESPEPPPVVVDTGDHFLPQPTTGYQTPATGTTAVSPPHEGRGVPLAGGRCGEGSERSGAGREENESCRVTKPVTLLEWSKGAMLQDGHNRVVEPVRLLQPQSTDRHTRPSINHKSLSLPELTPVSHPVKRKLNQTSLYSVPKKSKIGPTLSVGAATVVSQQPTLCFDTLPCTTESLPFDLSSIRGRMCCPKVSRCSRRSGVVGYCTPPGVWLVLVNNIISCFMTSRLLEGKESMAKSKVQTLLDHTLSTAPDLNSHLYTLHRMDS